MSRADVDAFLAECDDVISDWEGSADSATWTADGSHEHDTGGGYFGDDAARFAFLCSTVRWHDPLARADLRPYLDAIQEDLRDILGVAPLQPSASYQTSTPRPPHLHWDRRRDAGENDGHQVDWTIFDETARGQP